MIQLDMPSSRFRPAIFILLVILLYGAIAIAATGDDRQANKVFRLQKSDFLGAYLTDPEVTEFVEALNREKLSSKQLVELGTPKARAALLRLAYGEYKRRYPENMAYAYASSVTNESYYVRALLVADNNQVVRVGLLKLRNAFLDDELLALFKRVLEMPHPLERLTASEILSRMPGEIEAERKAQIIVQSIKTMADTTDVQAQITADGGGGFYYQGSQLEIASSGMAIALGRLKAVPVELLRKMTAAEAGLPRDCLMMARAAAGDGSALPEVHRLLTNSPSACVRYHALLMFDGKHPLTQGDRAALEFMAANDPFTADGTPDGYRMVYGEYDHQTNHVHWLRFMASKILKR